LYFFALRNFVIPQAGFLRLDQRILGGVGRRDWVCLGLDWVCFGFDVGFWYEKWLCFWVCLGLNWPAFADAMAGKVFVSPC
jgi:hypothetical protein